MSDVTTSPDLSHDVSTVESRPKIGALVRAVRRRQNLTLQALGQTSGLSVGYLSQIERDIATPSLSSLTRIAHALGVEVGQFMPVPHGSGIVNRAENRETTWINDGGMTYQRLHGDFPGATFSAFRITLPPGFVGEIDRHDGEEFVQLETGEVRFDIEGQPHALAPGDTLHFRSDMRHQAFNTSATEAAVIFWLGTSPVLRLRQEDTPRG
ncbi:helix-turn-helix domain-containing protein [Pseudoroseicyclus tamaricis]|uniref:Cupin domain-containing protein n=1 Tax=Pseudoroseicyclus tamaricis TaxID=2705421 RepID=A0A6B2JR72_9RHOB|nr:XRE family transcriptional regulator [Pseudoroseicyclus tamaricis]NDV00550.1 cupin domain-containing protein [Pseudoroseicyclus tamaricis]